MTNDRFIILLTKELCEQLNAAEREELSSILKDNPLFRDQRDLFKAYWEKDRNEYQASTALFKKVQEKIAAEETFPRPHNNSRRIWYSAAAALILTVVGISYFHHSSPKPQVTAEVRWLRTTTRPTQKDVLKLPDGTVVTLNSATTIKYPDHFSDSTREVFLEGEAYFDVSRNPAHPFIIHADKMNIRVLGTSFNVKSYKNEPSGEATLITGSIEVTLNDRPSDRIILKPKEKLIVQNNKATRKPLGIAQTIPDNTGKSTRYALTNLTYFRNNVNTVVETSWVENKLVFSNKDFIDISGDLERWYGVHIEFMTERAKHYNFSGYFEKETLPEALDVLRMIDHFTYKIEDSTVYIY
ncbi:MAG: FecR family protein [Bacteroidetes bacterium]|nr:FecR family protein [Bacteroidota bacterium]